jgi:hypothetical protein
MLDGAQRWQEMNYYLTCLRCLAEVDGFTPRQQEEHIEQLEHLTAGLVDGRNHCPAVPGQAPQRLGHEERRRAAQQYNMNSSFPQRPPWNRRCFNFGRPSSDKVTHLSRPLVGSSRNRSRGRMRSSRAMLTRRFSPPLTPRRCQLPMTVSAQSCRPISAMVPSTSTRLSSRGILSGSRSSAEYPIVSRTVSVPIRLSSCVTYACAKFLRQFSALPSSVFSTASISF